jgi:hypothetical protein
VTTNPQSRIPNLLRAGALLLAVLLAASAAARSVDVLRSVGAIPSHISGRFREAVGFQQAASGEYFVFDRRSHAVTAIDPAQADVREVVKIGAEEGRIIDPTAFAVAADGSFVVADAPNGRERIQIFSPGGSHMGGFLLPGRVMPRVVLDTSVMNGIGSLQYTGASILLSQPETGGLFNEYDLRGGVTRTIGRLRATGHENDREVHFALNSGIPLVDPTGGFYFVFQTGEPSFRKYDRAGQLVFERHVEGREIDPVVAALPTQWPRRRTSEGEMPLVLPTIRTAAVDPRGGLWVSFVIPYTYVFDRDGDKVRALQFRGAGIIAPSSLFFGKNGRLLITPGLYEFEP